jgi:hypothetical protein
MVLKHLLLLFVVIVTLALSVQPAISGESDDTAGLWRRVDIRINGGIAIPVSPERFSNRWDPGFTAGGGIAFWETEAISLVLNANYSQFPAGSYSRVVSNLYVSAGGRLTPWTSVVRPYFEAGLGYFGMGGEADDSALGIHGGLGAQISFVFLEAVYVLGFTDDDYTSLVTVRAGVSIEVSGSD